MTGRRRGEAFEADPQEEQPMSFGEVSSMVAYLPRDAQAVAVSLVDNSKIREMIGDDLAESVELYYWLRDSGAGNADAYAALNEALHYSAGAHEMLRDGDVREAYALAFLFRSKLCDAAYAVGMPELCEHTLAFGGTSTVGADPQWKVEERAQRRAANRARRDPSYPYNPGYGGEFGGETDWREYKGGRLWVGAHGPRVLVVELASYGIPEHQGKWTGYIRPAPGESAVAVKGKYVHGGFKSALAAKQGMTRLANEAFGGESGLTPAGRVAQVAGVTTLVGAIIYVLVHSMNR